MSAKLDQNEIMTLLDKLYDQSIAGIQMVSPSIETLANDYLQKSKDVDTAAKRFISYQVAKCTTSGFLTGLGGLITLPVAIPTNIGTVLYVQMRMIACLAYMGGYDTRSDQVQTLVYACLAGISMDQIFKSAGIEIGKSFATAMIKKIPGETLKKINQKVGFRLATKFGSKGVINLGKMVPVVGGVIGGGFDFAETRIIAARAYKMFVKGEITAPPDIVEDIEIIEEI